MNRAWFEPVKKWLQYSSQDLIVAREIASRDDLHPRIACFLSQQSVEKSLKAILSLNKVQFRKTHDLEQLLFDVPEEVSIYLEDLDIGWLTSWVITGRYPGDWPEATRKDASRAIEIATEVYEFTEKVYSRAVTEAE